MKMKTIPHRYLALLLLCCPLLLTAQSDEESPNSDQSADSERNLTQNYLLHASDLLYFSVFQESDMEVQTRISADGTIRLPMIGKVQVGGLTLADARERIYRLYDADYLVDPQITLEVLEFSERTVKVLGQVNRPGPVVIPPDKPLTIVDAITRANGFTRLANKRKVSLKTTDNEGNPLVIELNINQIMSDPSVPDIPLKDGDTIHVPEDFL